MSAQTNGRKGLRVSVDPVESAPPALAVAKILAVAAIAAAAAWGAFMLFKALSAQWEAQCAVPDVTAPGAVTIEATPHVNAETVKYLFGLTNGCNLARIDFAARREEAMRKYPVFEAIDISLRLPSSVTVSVRERRPAVRVNVSSSVERSRDGRATRIYRWQVADAEGVVFDFPREDSRDLPRITDGRNRQLAKRGERLSGKALCALRAAEMFASKDMAGISLDTIDISNATYMTAVFDAPTGSGNVAKIDWELLDDPGDRIQARLKGSLAELKKCIATGLPGPGTEFTISQYGRVTMQGVDKEPVR